MRIRKLASFMLMGSMAAGMATLLGCENAATNTSTSGVGGPVGQPGANGLDNGPGSNGAGGVSGGGNGTSSGSMSTGNAGH